MSEQEEQEKQDAQYFVDWMSPAGGGVAQWLQHFLDQGDEAKLREIKVVYDKLKTLFGF